MTPDFEEKQSGASGVLLWLFAGVALFMFLGLNALWGSEGRWAEIAREMLITGDFLHPSVNWQMLHNEPLLSYWEIIPFIKFFGLNELTVRIPSALSALIGLGAAFILARKLFDRSTALLGSWMLLSTYGFLFWSRTVSAESAGMTAAVLAVVWFYYAENKSQWLKYPVFYLFLSIGAAAKGFAAVLPPIVFLLPHLLAEKRWQKELKVGNFLFLPVGILLCLLPGYLAWRIPPEPGLFGNVPAIPDFFQVENLLKIFSLSGGGDSPFSCVGNLPRLLLPWLPFFVIAAFGAVVRWKELDAKYREFWTGILLLIVLFTVNPPRRWYAILPLLPFCCIITAAMFYRKEESKDFQILTRVMYWVVVFAASLAFAAPVMLPVFKMMFNDLPPKIIILSLPLAGLATIIICIMDNEPGNRIEHLCGIPHLLVSAVLGTAILMATGLGAVRPGMTVYRTGKPFIQRLIPHLAGIAEKNIVFYETDSTADFQFYLRWKGPATVVSQKEFIALLRNSPGEKIAVICSAEEQIVSGLAAALKSAGVSVPLPSPVVREEGRGKKWTLYLLEIPFTVKKTVQKISENSQ